MKFHVGTSFQHASFNDCCFQSGISQAGWCGKVRWDYLCLCIQQSVRLFFVHLQDRDGSFLEVWIELIPHAYQHEELFLQVEKYNTVITAPVLFLFTLPAPNSWMSWWRKASVLVRVTRLDKNKLPKPFANVLWVLVVVVAFRKPMHGLFVLPHQQLCLEL